LSVNRWVPLLVIAACARPPSEPPEQPGGLVLRQVTLEAWRGARQTLRGTAPALRYERGTFAATGVDAELQDGAHIHTQDIHGDADGIAGQLERGTVLRTADGCTITGGVARYDRRQIRIEPPFHLDGCGAVVDAKAVTYDVLQHRAQFEGPVTTRVEAQR
jgi:hypothetical protein